MIGTPEHGAPNEATVAAYLANRLDPAQADAFEVYCLRNPDFARRVESDLLLKVGLKQLQGPNSGRRGYRRSKLLAIAAGIILVISCGLVLFRSVQPGLLLAYGAETQLPSLLLGAPQVGITLIRLREGTAVHRIVAPREAKVLTVRVVPDSPPGALGYLASVSLESQAKSPVILQDLHADADGNIELYLPLAAIVGQTARITLNPSPVTNTESLSFRLQVEYAQAAP